MLLLLGVCCFGGTWPEDGVSAAAGEHCFSAATAGIQSRVFPNVLPKCASLTTLQAESRLRKADLALDTAEVFK